jgi:hypothetical protein
MPNNKLPQQNSDEIEKSFEELVEQKIHEHFNPKINSRRQNIRTNKWEEVPAPAYSREIEDNLKKMWNEPENKERLMNNEKQRVQNAKAGRIERELKKQSETSQSADQKPPIKPASDRGGAKIRGF